MTVRHRTAAANTDTVGARSRIVVAGVRRLGARVGRLGLEGPIFFEMGRVGFIPMLCGVGAAWKGWSCVEVEVEGGCWSWAWTCLWRIICFLFR